MVDSLEIQNIIKRYNDKLILSDVYLKLETNKTIGVFGRNGSGKSTLFRVIYGIEVAENCQIRLNGNIISKPFTHKNLISYSTQDSFFPQHISVHKALKLFFGNIPEPIETRFKNILGTKIGSVSGGEQKLLQLFTILNFNSRFVILDEPFNHLSPIMCEEAKKLISEHATEKCIIISDHSYDNVLDLSQENYLLKDGSLRKLESKNNLYESNYVNSNFW